VVEIGAHRIRSGAFSNVYKALDLSTQKKVASEYFLSPLCLSFF
jgi:hypothetical protein